MQHGCPHRAASTGEFVFRFPELQSHEVPSEAVLRDLAKLGEHNGVLQRKSADDQRDFPAGFTYLGQMLDHNVTFDSGSVLQTPGHRTNTATDPSKTVDRRSGFLDLENIYGGGPTGNHFSLYDTRPDHEGKFYLDSEFDVPRNTQGTALIADPRDDNNVIILQIHRAFMVFHNHIVDKLREAGTPPSKLFHKARRLVLWHYQAIILREYLPRIIKPDVLADIEKNGLRLMKNLYADGRPKIPLEFSLAAYRLHPMVRQKYKINEVFKSDDPKDPPGVGTLFKLRREPFKPLAESSKIDFSHFFAVPGSDITPTQANKFLPNVTETFLNMPGPIDNPLPDNIPPTSEPFLRSILSRNFLRAASFGAAWGQDLAHVMVHAGFATHVYSNEEIGLSKAEFAHAKAPLWYYIFGEAQKETGGVTLGTIGSRIVGEVFWALLSVDPHSIFREGKPDFTLLHESPAQLGRTEPLKMGELVIWPKDKIETSGEGKDGEKGAQ